MVRYSGKSNQISHYVLTFILITTLAMFCQSAQAQDANYWTHQYGSRSTLLGGAVIGSVLDLSGTYYNPGAISLIEDPDIILAAKVFEYPTYTLETSLYNNIELNSSSLGPAPSLVALLLNFDWLGKHKLAFSFLTRYDFRLELAESNAYSINSEDLTDVITNLTLNERMIESWFGINWSYKLGPKVGIGATPYLVFRSHNSYGQSMIQTIAQDDYFMALDNKEYDYDHYSLLLKAGITFDFIGHTIGMTITTPRISIYNNGSSGTNNTIRGINPFINSEDITYVAADYQKDVGVEYKSPFSTAIGTTFKIDRTNLYISAEWFSAIEKYDVITPRYFEAQIGPDTLSHGISSESRSVINLGVGLQYTFNNSYTINASFTTDYTANVPDSDTNLSFASWDIYHFMLGGSFSVLESEITLGLGYTFGSEDVQKSFNTLESLNQSTVPSSLDGVKFSYQTIKFIIGFSY